MQGRPGEVSRSRLRITIDLDVEGESIQGLIASRGGRHPFSGWLGLLAELDRIVTDGAAGIPPPGGPAGRPEPPSPP